MIIDSDDLKRNYMNPMWKEYEIKLKLLDNNE